jgi:hypothetical protein
MEAPNVRRFFSENKGIYVAALHRSKASTYGPAIIQQSREID